MPAATHNLAHEVDSSVMESVMRQVVVWRRHIHAHPDLSFDEVPTANYIAEELHKIDHSDGKPVLNICRPIPNSVVVDLCGQRAGPTSKEIIALRADCDALPIDEQSDEPFSSTKPGVMHACGHDAHTASLMGAVVLLRQQVAHISGTVRFLFQPAEELAPGGALQLIEHGCLDGVSLIFGLHMDPRPLLPTGTVAIREGVMFGSCDDLCLTFTGRGGHASMPEHCVDLVALSAQVITGLQYLVTRQLPAAHAPVLTIAAIHSNTSGFNVLPSSVELKGTLRAVDPVVRDTAIAAIERLATGMASLAKAECTIDVRPGYPATVNHSRAYQLSQQVLRETLGESQVRVLSEPNFPVEDFSYYAQKVPGNYYLVGCHNASKGCIHSPHNCRYRLDEDAMETAVRAHYGHIHHILM